MQQKLSKAEQRAFYNSKEWRLFRLTILDRDNWECQDCKDEGKTTTVVDAVLEIDHLKELAYYPELALDPDNCRTRCKMHHNKRHKRFNFKESKRQKKWNDEWW